ncbi:MAG: DUF2238 domain-containing protein [Aquabacterium sp.]|nr:DUF2238 domain-containing protein [Aquabacterium sp.]
MTTLHRQFALLILTCALLALSSWHAFDLGVWAMEVAPVFVALPLLVISHRRFEFTPLVITLIFIHACILMLGGHYTYARVPLGFWMQDLFDLHRNHYDRIGHLAQGFVPAMVARELLLRHGVLKRGAWLFTLITLSCLGISALYELLEWGAAVSLGSGADEFLATQGDQWDTQSDMFMAWMGAMLAQTLLSRWHDRQLAVKSPSHLA